MNKPTYHAHSGNLPEFSDWQLLSDHLIAVGDLSQINANHFNGDELAKYAG